MLPRDQDILILFQEYTEMFAIAKCLHDDQ